MNKPDWKDAPEWANWLAMDGDWNWWWHEEKPDLIGMYYAEWTSAGMVDLARSTVNWKETLEARP